MSIADLNEQFGLPGLVWFEEFAGLKCVRIDTPSAKATIFLQGAHVTHWEPSGQAPVLFLSERAEFKAGKAIRGGIPISFPWFATDTKQDRVNGRPGPSHGFARIQPWDVAFAAVAGEEVHLTLTLGATDLSRSMGFGQFRLAYQVTVGRELSLQLAVANEGASPLHFEEALHTYFAVGDVRQSSVTGLEAFPYIDKTLEMKEIGAANEALRFSGETDRVYPNAAGACLIHDSAGGRLIRNDKSNSETTVVFNPWKALPDLGEDQWPKFVCVETANTGRNAITLAPGAVHTMGARISVEKVGQ